MNKTLLIIQREYLTRVRKKTFIIGTILFPLLYIAMIFGSSYLAKKNQQNLKVGVIDHSGYFSEKLIREENRRDSLNELVLIKTSESDFVKQYDTLGYNGYIVIPAGINWETKVDSLGLNTKKTYGLGVTAPISAKLNNIWDRIKNDGLGIDNSKQEMMRNSTIKLRLINSSNKESDAGIATGIGYVCGFLMYLILLLYGSQVMMGVTEEKTNRIAEVMVSSVKPFQLMLGKIVGIAMVALTQFLIWIACIFLIYNFSKGSVGENAGALMSAVGSIQKIFSSVNMVMISACFIFYLLGGFFFYSSLYAAIGSAINEDMREAQSLSFPITMLVIFSILLMAPTISNPSSPLAVWASIIPFSSPIVMMARIPFGVPSTVPFWQLGLSMLFLIAGFIFTTWFAGKIYRTGILMYGKKPSWKEMIKWAFRK